MRFEAARLLPESLLGRIVALDYGRRRIGIAVTDPSRTIASPHGVVPNDDPPEVPPAVLLDLLAELEPSIILLGIPINVDGSAGPMAAEARRFGAGLSSATGVTVREWDERFTSEEADALMLDLEIPRKRRQRKGLRDALAALVMLREYLGEAPGPDR